MKKHLLLALGAICLSSASAAAQIQPSYPARGPWKVATTVTERGRGCAVVSSAGPLNPPLVDMTFAIGASATFMVIEHEAAASTSSPKVGVLKPDTGHGFTLPVTIAYPAPHGRESVSFDISDHALDILSQFHGANSAKLILGGDTYTIDLTGWDQILPDLKDCIGWIIDPPK